MAGEAFEAAVRDGRAADVLHRLGHAWWLWLLFGWPAFTYDGREPGMMILMHVGFALYLIYALERLEDVLPESSARRLWSVVLLAVAATMIRETGEMYSPWHPRASLLAAGVAAMAFAGYLVTMQLLARDEWLLGAVVPLWRRSRGWSFGVIAAGSTAAMLWLTSALPAAGSSAEHAVRAVAGGFVVAAGLCWVGALLNTATATRATREVFEHQAAILHGPIVQSPG